MQSLHATNYMLSGCYLSKMQELTKSSKKTVLQNHLIPIITALALPVIAAVDLVAAILLTVTVIPLCWLHVKPLIAFAKSIALLAIATLCILGAGIGGKNTISTFAPEVIKINRGIHPDSAFEALEINIPTMEELQQKSLREIHQLWRMNQEILVGIVAQEKIPKIGFHGTDKAGMEGIEKTHKSLKIYQKGSETIESESDIWIAGYTIESDYKLDFLADLYTIIDKAASYQSESGGIFTVCTNEANAVNYKYIYNNEQRFQETSLDSPAEKYLNKQICRNRAADMNRDRELITSPAVEMKLGLSPENYSKRVLRLFKNEHRKLTKTTIKELFPIFCGPSRQKDDPDKYILAYKLSIQEILFDTFKQIKGVDSQPLLKHDWKTYQTKGIALLKTGPKFLKLQSTKLVLFISNKTLDHI